MGGWGVGDRVAWPALGCIVLLAAGLLAAPALGGPPTPDPAPVATTPVKPKPAPTHASAPQTTPRYTPPATTHVSSTSSSSTTTHTVTRPAPKPRPKATHPRSSVHAVAPKPKPRPKPRPIPRPAKTTPAQQQASSRPVSLVTAAAQPSSKAGLARTLLYALAFLFLALAALPWRRAFDSYVAPDRIARIRVAFVTVGLSVGFGAVIATYLNGVS